jgi:hypothetical protein
MIAVLPSNPFPTAARRHGWSTPTRARCEPLVVVIVIDWGKLAGFSDCAANSPACCAALLADAWVGDAAAKSLLKLRANKNPRRESFRGEGSLLVVVATVFWLPATFLHATR